MTERELTFYYIIKLSLSHLRKYGVLSEPAKKRLRSESVAKETRPGGDGKVGIQDQAGQ